MKSRDRLTTTITKRSNHMPMLTHIAIINSAGTLVRTRWNHRACGTSTLNKIKAQYIIPYGPNIRFSAIDFS